MLPISLWTFISILATTHALSSSSPPDLLASPKSEITLTRAKVSNETATELLANRKGQYKLLRSANGQAFLCQLPEKASVAMSSVPPLLKPDTSLYGLTREERKKRSQERTEAGLQKGLSLLEPLKNSCLYLKQGWFTYAFCHGSEIRQFHEIKVINAQGQQSPAEDPNTESYSLGVYPTTESVPASLNAAGDGVGLRELLAASYSDVDLSFAESGNPDDADQLQRDGFSNTKRYLVQKWGGGTVCDMTGMARQIEVQFHCNTQSTDRIALIRETAICEYLMVVHTPRLCSEPLFLASGDSNSNDSAVQNINCRPVVSSLASTRPEIASTPITVPSPDPEAEEAPQEELSEETPLTQEEEELAQAVEESIGTATTPEEIIMYFDPQTGEMTSEHLTADDKPAGTGIDEDFYKKLVALVEKSFEAVLKEAANPAQDQAANEQEQAGNDNMGGIVKALMNNQGLRKPPARHQQKTFQRLAPNNNERPYIGSTTQQNLKGIYGETFDGQDKADKDDQGRGEDVDDLKPHDEL